MCKECKKKRQTLDVDRSLGLICAKCLRTKVPKEQLSIFDAINND